jgi:hypothetical protein
LRHAAHLASQPLDRFASGHAEFLAR